MTKTKFLSFMSSPTFRKDFSVIAIVAIIAAIPLTVISSQRQQEIRQRAAVNECVYAFSAQSVCETYCAEQNEKKCQQNEKNKWGCCQEKIEPEEIITPGPKLPSGVRTCARCSDTYKYSRVQWNGNVECTDTENAKYLLDCKCTEGTIDSKIKGLNTSSCKNTIEKPIINQLKNVVPATKISTPSSQ